MTIPGARTRGATTSSALGSGATAGPDGAHPDGAHGVDRPAAGVDDGRDRGDVPGWVLVTLMTAGLVLGLWAVADTALTQMFTEAMNDVQGR